MRFLLGFIPSLLFTMVVCSVLGWFGLGLIVLFLLLLGIEGGRQ